MSRNRMFRTMWASLMVFSLVAFLGACGGGGGDSGGAAGTTGTITLEASASSIPADGTSSVIIKATIKDSAGNPVRHYTEVTFTTNLGYFRNGSTTYTMQTQPPLGENGLPDIKAAPMGIAEVTFTGGHIGGAAKITATSIGVTQSVYVTVTGSSAGITLTANPTTIPADGHSSTTITATLTDSGGKPVKPGTEVTFSTGLGHFLSDSKSYTVSTPDTTGVVQVSLNSGVVPGTTYVQATSGNVAQALSIVLTKTDPLYADISVEANPARIPADGKSQSVITATVIQTKTGDPNHAPEVTGQPISGVPVTFYKITSNVEPQPLPEANTYKGTGTSIAGPFYSYGGMTTFYMTAVPPTSTTQEYFTVWLFNPLSTERELLINRSNWGSNDTLLQEKGLSLLPGNYQLEIQTNCYYEVKVVGDIGPAQTGKTVLGFGLTDEDGQAVHTYTADWLPGTFNVRAETGELSNSDNALRAETALTQTQGTAGPIEIAAASDTIYANGKASTSVTAQVWTHEGNKAPDGTIVYFSATSGTITASSNTVDGLASAELISVSSSSSVVSTVTATVGTDSASTTVTFVGVTLSDMQANPATIFANGTDTSEISVRIRDANGLAVVGETVTFTTTLGSIQTATTTTDNDGVAKTNLIASTTTGSATVTAAYGLITATTTVIFTSSVPVGTIALTANPTSIPADGTSSSTITATLKDTSGKAVPKGTLVTFTTNLGKLGSGNQTQTVITPDTSGVVSVSLISGVTSGSATVTATSSTVTQSVTVTFTGTVVGSIAVTATPSTLTADSASTSVIRAAVTDTQGNPISDGETITFTITSGTGTLSASSATTIGGYATVTYTAGNTAGSVIIQARAQNNVSGTVTITLTSGGVGSITLTASPTSIPANGSSSSTITATLTDLTGKPVTKGTAVTFSTTLGTLSSTSVTTPDDTGVVTVSLIAGTTPGTATVSAQSGSVKQSVMVKFSGPPANITVSATPQTLVADGQTTSSVKATVLDVNGNTVEDGEILTASAQFGSISDINPKTASGVATITYTSPSAVPAGGTDTVGFKASNGVSGNATITLTGPQVATVILSADPAAIPANGTSTSTISATVTVQGGSPAPEGTSVTFTITSSSGGSFGGQKTTTKTTDANGVARATLTAGSSSGTETIKAEAAGVSSNVITVTYQPGSITLTIVPNSLLATGASAAVVTAALKDVSGAPAPNGATVNFSLSDTTLGALSATSATTSGGTGEASVTFTSGTKGGKVTVTATWTTGGNTVTGTADITIQAAPAFIEVASGYPLPTTINIKGTGGQSTSELRFNVKDAKGNLVASGYRVDFSILTGPNGGEDLIPPSATTSDGQVITFLHSGVKSGPVSVKATYHDDSTINTTASQIVIVSGPPVGEAFGIAAQYVNISGFWVAGLADPVTANAADIYGNAIPDGTAVAFKTYNTGGYFATGGGSTTQGRATDNLMSGGTYLRPLNGFLSITAEAVGGNSTHITALEVAPGTNIVYAGTNGGGVYKSIDKGATWENISRSSENPKQGQNWIDPYVKGQSAISVDPDNTDVVYVGTGYLGRGHVYRSKDGGANWNSNNAEEWNGVYSGKSAVLTVLCDDGSDYVWIGTEGDGAFYAVDGVTFTAAASPLAYGTSVREIVKVPGTTGATAHLYAATHTGVYYSTDGGQTWPTRYTFSENNVNTLAIHPTSNTVLYAGTENAGVWVSTNSGTSWTQYYPNGMGKGLSASVPVADANNRGNGSMSDVAVETNTQSEFWAVTCTAAAADGGTFKVEGSVSGLQTNSATVGAPYTSATGDISFLISDGTVDFKKDDFFTFTTIRDPGKTIKDLMVDANNNRLYAITYYSSPIEPYHAVGNVYVHQLNADGSMTAGNWTEANSGLPQFEPPNDTTLFAQYVMATDDETSPTYFLIGGDGINLYRATAGLTTGKPEWRTSKTGLSNLLMARMPILFSGVCTMNITQYQGYVGADGATTAGEATFTSSSAGFVADDVNDYLTILSGPDAGSYKITSVDSSTQVTLGSFSPSVTATDLKFNLPDRFANGFAGTDGATTVGASTFTSVSAGFVASDVGTTLIILSGTSYKGIYTITSRLSDTQVTLAGLSATTVETELQFSLPDRVEPSYGYFIYIQDTNGNPPISGSTFTAITYDAKNTIIATLANIEYPDAYTHQGTFSDPADDTTDHPYAFNVDFSGLVDHVTFKFTPTNKTTVPGSSGSIQEVTYTH